MREPSTPHVALVPLCRYAECNVFFGSLNVLNYYSRAVIDGAYIAGIEKL